MSDTDTRVRDLHREAMERAECAARCIDPRHAKAMRKRAMEDEAYAADLCTVEPARSVLYRSAATLALDAGEPAEAVRLAQKGLEGSPPEEIAEELKDVLHRAMGEKDGA